MLSRLRYTSATKPIKKCNMDAADMDVPREAGGCRPMADARARSSVGAPFLTSYD